MKKQLLLLGGFVLFGFMACNNPTPSTTTTNTDTMKTNPGDTVVRTTTTTTTTTKTVHPIANFEHRTFYNVKTHKQVKLRIDTVNHYYVDVNSNSQPDYFYYDPATRAEFAKIAVASSPVHFLKGWRSPVLFIHGDDDRNVPFNQTVNLIEKLRAQHVYFEQLIFPDEVHSFLLHSNWLKAYHASSEFFTRKLLNR